LVTAEQGLKTLELALQIREQINRRQRMANHVQPDFDLMTEQQVAAPNALGEG
jgi:hypothetical protein